MRTAKSPISALERGLAGGVLIFAASLALSACGGAVPPAPTSAEDCSARNESAQSITFFGDSQTAGYVTAAAGCRYSWSYVVASALRSNVTNRAIGGSSLRRASSAGPSQLTQILSATLIPGDTVMWEAAFNDALFVGADAASLVDFCVGFTEALTYLANAGVRAYVLTPFLLPGNPQQQAAASAYAAVITEAAVNFPNITVINLQAAVSIPQSEIQADGVHLTREGEYRIATAVLVWLKDQGIGYELRDKHYPHSREYFEVRRTA